MLNPLRTNINSTQTHLSYLEALRLSCAKNIELANQELQEEKELLQLDSNKSNWFTFITGKKSSLQSERLDRLKSNLCRQILNSKKINEFNSKQQRIVS